MQKFKSWGDYSLKERTKAAKDLFYWQHGNSRSFTDGIFILFQKADKENLNKLRQGFNLHYMAFIEWGKADNYGDDFFKIYDLIK